MQRLLAAGVDLLGDPLWSSLLHVAYQKQVAQLRIKTQIPVDPTWGALLLAVPDGSGVLGREEVFYLFIEVYSILLYAL
jgi:hypothetical protein